MKQDMKRFEITDIGNVTEAMAAEKLLRVYGYTWVGKFSSFDIVKSLQASFWGDGTMTYDKSRSFADPEYAKYPRFNWNTEIHKLLNFLSDDTQEITIEISKDYDAVIQPDGDVVVGCQRVSADIVLKIAEEVKKRIKN
jgi:hypothetical protein